MREYERNLFEGRCPYTDELCDDDIDCADCVVNQEEKTEMELIQRDDGTWEKYDDTYDLTIHCRSEEEYEKTIEFLQTAVSQEQISKMQEAVRKAIGRLLDANYNGVACDACFLTINEIIEQYRHREKE